MQSTGGVPQTLPLPKGATGLNPQQDTLVSDVPTPARDTEVALGASLERWPYCPGRSPSPMDVSPTYPIVGHLRVVHHCRSARDGHPSSPECQRLTRQGGSIELLTAPSYVHHQCAPHKEEHHIAHDIRKWQRLDDSSLVGPSCQCITLGLELSQPATITSCMLRWGI